MLTQARLKELLNYDPITGIFTWVKPTSYKIKTGDIAGCKDSGYIRIVISKKLYRAHRLAWLYMTGNWPTQFIDHVNMVRDCNIWTNLRECSFNQNLHNVGITSRNKSGFKGVSWNKKCSKWVATAGVNGKAHHLGCYDTPEQAAEAYKTFAKSTRGEFYREIS